MLRPYNMIAGRQAWTEVALMAGASEEIRTIRLRLVCLAAPDQHGDTSSLGLQDKQQALQRGHRREDGAIKYECEVRVARSPERGGPRLRGPYVHGRSAAMAVARFPCSAMAGRGRTPAAPKASFGSWGASWAAVMTLPGSRRSAGAWGGFRDNGTAVLLPRTGSPRRTATCPRASGCPGAPRRHGLRR
jgi:hypothetical protein